ncbi:hypothetical protein QJS64_12895 [Paraclostridium bifermentans]|uniref:Lipoprotein n=1 Tax=Paraclostridium bifermentans TaxID=1490 RepID=A0ABY8R0D0_PARBF|nr:hypothetical protein QJS64_12895 [Paraclostridium bifermentans]
MVQMKISKKVLALIIMTTTIGFAVVGCNSNDNKGDVDTTKVEENKSSGKSESTYSKEDIKSEIESNISEDVKGTSYTVDMLTPTEGEGFIVSIQVDNNKFTTEEECKGFTTDLIKHIKSIEGIHSVEITFIADSQAKYMVRIEDWNKNKDKENLVDTLDFSI